MASERERLQALVDGLARTEIGIDIVGTDHRIYFQDDTLRQRFGELGEELCYRKYMGRVKPCDSCPVMRAIERDTVESRELLADNG